MRRVGPKVTFGKPPGRAPRGNGDPPSSIASTIGRSGARSERVKRRPTRPASGPAAGASSACAPAKPRPGPRQTSAGGRPAAWPTGLANDPTHTRASRYRKRPRHAREPRADRARATPARRPRSATHPARRPRAVSREETRNTLRRGYLGQAPWRTTSKKHLSKSYETANQVFHRGPVPPPPDEPPR